MFVLLTALFAVASAKAQSEGKQPDEAPFRIGERLTYNVSFENLKNAGFFETYVISRGKIGDQDVFELRSRAKTADLLSATYYLVDETRTVFAAANTGLPIYLTRTLNDAVVPKQIVSNYATAPASSLDLLTLMYSLRNSNANVFTLREDEKVYTVTVQSGTMEKVRTDSGDFETSAIILQSDYLTERGVSDLKINITNDDVRIPAMVRFKTAKGKFIVTLAGMQIIGPNPEPQPTPSVVPSLVPVPTLAPTPKPEPKETPYFDDQPLPADLPFLLGEKLDYRISIGGRSAAVMTVSAKERKMFAKTDSLLLAARITSVEPGNGVFFIGDLVDAQVNPESLAPKHLEIKFAGSLNTFNQIADFDQDEGFISIGGVKRVDSPVGTHSIISLLYAARSFDLKPGKELTDPVNDTRVAVLWDSKPEVFILRPSTPALIDHEGKKVSAQMVSVSTGGQNPQLDQLSIKLWLSTDRSRVPLKITAGAYQAELITPENSR